MKKNILEFIRRGMLAAGIGPIILAILYLILQRQGAIETLTVNQVCTGIISLFVLAFIAGGMNVVYQIEQLPLMIAIFMHGGVLYISYLATYLINDWLEWGAAPIFAFTVIFLLGYMVIWGIIYSTTKRKTDELNEILKEKHHNLRQG